MMGLFVCMLMLAAQPIKTPAIIHIIKLIIFSPGE